jgi:hypothetical protein
MQDVLAPRGVAHDDDFPNFRWLALLRLFVIPNILYTFGDLLYIFAKASKPPSSIRRREEHGKERPTGRLESDGEICHEANSKEAITQTSNEEETMRFASGVCARGVLKRDKPIGIMV